MITIIVLLILAGITINSMTSENAMEKASEAREKNEQGEKLEQIKLATINAITSGDNGLVTEENLANALEGIISSEQIQTLRTDATETKANLNGPWTVVGDNGIQYEIDSNGTINDFKTVFVTNETELIAALKDGKCIIKLSNDIALSNTLKITSSNIRIQSSDSTRRKIYAISDFVAENNRMIIIGDGTNGINVNINNVDLVANGSDENKYGVLIIKTASQLNISDSKVTGGYTPNLDHGAGGVSYGKVVMDNVEMCDNYGFRGGGFYTQNGAETIIKNSLIHSNSISKDYAGGLYVNTSGKLIVENSKIYDNSATHGSAIFAAGDVELTNVEIYNNSPVTAIFMTNWGKKPVLTLNNCNFHDNYEDIRQM